MVQISVIRPLDQPQGLRRLLEDLKAALAEPGFTRFRLAVAFAKSGPLLRLKSLLEKWRAAGKQAEAIFGIDHQGTSRQALELSIKLFDKVYIHREPGFTFHPKIYLFNGPAAARCLIGSNNLTVGGTETNFEMSVCLDLELPAERETFKALRSSWTDLLPSACLATKPLNTATLKTLVALGLVPDETTMRSVGLSVGGGASTAKAKSTRSGLAVKPPSPLPRNLLKAVTKSVGKPSIKTVPPTPAPAATTPPIPPVRSIAARGFAIQIKPHHNGEIFLSVTAAFQNPMFFHWPFAGLTTPKKP